MLWCGKVSITKQTPDLAAILSPSWKNFLRKPRAGGGVGGAERDRDQGSTGCRNDFLHSLLENEVIS